MAKQRTHEELVKLLHEGKISALHFIMQGEDAQDYLEWCYTHAIEPSSETAEFYLDQTDITQEELQMIEEGAYGL